MSWEDDWLESRYDDINGDPGLNDGDADYIPSYEEEEDDG